MFEQILACLNIQRQTQRNTELRVNVNSFVDSPYSMVLSST